MRLGEVDGPTWLTSVGTHRPTDPLARAAHEHGRPIRHAVEAGPFDDERPGGRREAQVERSARAAAAGDRRSQDRGLERGKERVTGTGRVGLAVVAVGR